MQDSQEAGVKNVKCFECNTIQVYRKILIDVSQPTPDLEYLKYQFNDIELNSVLIKNYFISVVIQDVLYIFLIFNFFNYTDIQYYISFRCTAQWLDICITYKVIPPISPGKPLTPHIVITILTIFPMLYFTSL